MIRTRNSKKRQLVSRSGFSLIELVVVVVIIGIIAAIAIPKMSKGAQGAADSALIGDLKLFRQAIDMYANEHGGLLPDATNIAAQLTQYSSADGARLSATKDPTNQIVFGPYLRSVPPLPVTGTGKGSVTIGATGSTTAGWIYDATAGTVIANSAGTDSGGTAYNTY